MKVSIVGITGYSGLELLKILNNHKKVQVVSIHATKEVGQCISDIYPHLTDQCDLVIEAFDAAEIMSKSDLVFFATPSGIASHLSEPFVEAGFPVIDLSGDHRLSATSYSEWYAKEPAKQAILDQFVYGLAEFTDVKGKKFIANPGCYATATELALLPLVQAEVLEKDSSIIVDAKSGLTGAGKGLSDSSHFVNVHDNYVTYKLNKHQHIPEIEQALHLFDADLLPIQFSTSLLPINRGIVSTSYLKVKEGVSQEAVQMIFEKAYADKVFVRLSKGLPDLHQVLGTNYTDIGFQVNEKTGILTVISVIDNLIKGAAGQAVQNLNLMMGWDEAEGLPVQATYL
ncbi:N-acetyl-gamma-glutamyl-phosphate reductase [Streptococcus saliviloxodontae]|uniref:N-acetyl-gamma-glutamyl-phosphate reductase n=1 Tax=Streptococcus saliviloxodontae TaxID=1349416 RepID=A0ABS2PNA7_9STRE|nr:N-acetyl-gamma-glutamyl-phosphate reductase [Streptococcus saliviloxodontae]MBM7636586.1 N-acetyl-gamma-glutamyl-phosphate reductase [Streptococcus saliviloxodontae]